MMIVDGIILLTQQHLASPHLFYSFWLPLHAFSTGFLSRLDVMMMGEHHMLFSYSVHKLMISINHVSNVHMMCALLCVHVSALLQLMYKLLNCFFCIL